MDFVTPIITPVVESLLVPTKKHLGFLVSSSNYVRDMQAKVRELDGAVEDMHTRQVSNQVNSQMVPSRVPGWLKDVEDIKASVEQIPTRGVGCFNIKTKYTAGKKSSDIVKDIERLMKEKAEMVWTNEIIPLATVGPLRPSTCSAVQYDNQNQNKYRIESRDLIFNDALKFLEPNNIKTQKMALCGMAGVGKTTMMEELEKAAIDRRMFDSIVKVAVGQNPNLVAIQQSVAEYTGGALSETTKDARAERLKKRFEGMSEQGKKKILVILDDVWEEFSLKNIGLTSPLPTGFKLLLTSREETVCTQMGVEKSLIFRIIALEELEAKRLFWDTVGRASDGDIEHDLYQIGEDIIERCGGLPIAINTIASSLRDINEKDEWKDALYRIQNKSIPVISNIFEFSYQNLKDDDVKSIFLLSGLFPEDYNIRKEDLLRYGWGLKFFRNVCTIAEARTRVNTCVNRLIRSNLLIKSDYEGCIKMHDLVRDFVLSSVSKVKQASIVCHNNNVFEQLKNKSYERILLKCEGMTDFPEDFIHPNLALLKLMDGYRLLKFPEYFYSRMEKLEVVAYHNINRPMLPPYSTNLQALCLLSCSLTNVDISFLGDLVNLEVLSLVDCEINKLPSKIGKLKRLKLLDLTKSVILCIADGVFRNLEKLEELYMGVYKEDIVRFTDANCDELKILSRKLSALELEFFQNKAQAVNVSFESLERFRISMGCQLESNNDKYIFENTLMLVTSSSELLECKINKLFRKTELLYLEVNDMSYVEDILMHPPQSSFCNLKALDIFDCAGLTYLFPISMTKVLTKLESLEIRSCPLLKSVVKSENTEATVITFHKLKNLSLQDLPELIGLCEPVNVIKLPELTELELEELPNITSIFPHNSINVSAEQPFLNKDQVVIPKLQKLSISKMKNLKEIWLCNITSSKEEVNKISSLREIKVSSCDNLVNLFPSNPMQLLIHLEELKVIACGSIEVLFNIDFRNFNQHNSSIKLRRIQVCNCESFREVWRIKNAKNNLSDLLICGFSVLEHITISSCKRFRNIVTPTTVNLDMRALKVICIHSCGKYGDRSNGLVNNCQQINAMSKEDISIAFPSHQITNNFHQLRKITLDEFEGVEVMFEIESPSNIDQLVTTQQQQSSQLLPYLEDLKLSSMEALSHVWKCNNWNEFFILHKHQPQSSFQNLTSIHLSDCKSIKYLFSPLMVELLCNLKEVHIFSCDGMEEVVSNNDDEEEEKATSISTYTTTTLFRHLQLLELSNMDNLKHIGGGGVAKGTTYVSLRQSKFSQLNVVYWSFCHYFKRIYIGGCNALSSVFPCYVVGAVHKLEDLIINYCSSMVEVFETNEIDINHCSNSTTLAIPRPIISTMHKLPNLKNLTINHCDRLENIFTFSTLKTLNELETLTIRDCEAMKVIVKEEYGEHTTTSSTDVRFPRLKSVILDHLPNLEGFFLGMNIDFEWPLLDYVKIIDCPKMMVFTSGESKAPRLKHLHTKLGKHNLESDINFHMAHQTPSTSLDDISSRHTISEGRLLPFHTLSECCLKCSYDDKKVFLSDELQQLQKLETIHVVECYNVEEVFDVSPEATSNESQTIVKFPKLREMEFKSLYKLKYIWKSNQWRILEFPHLTTLSISFCGLEHVFTCSMVGCVMQLQELHIERCENIKVIVKEEEDCDAKVSEIKFPCLKSLKLNNLSSLEGFSLGKEDIILPSLDTLVIKNCPIIKVFSEGHSITPQLIEVETSLGSFNVGEDINSIIMREKQ